MNAHRTPGPDRFIPSPAVRRWLYGIAAAVVPALVLLDVVTGEEGAAWLAVAGAILGVPVLGLAAANTPPSRRRERSGTDSVGG